MISMVSICDNVWLCEAMVITHQKSLELTHKFSLQKLVLLGERDYIYNSLPVILDPIESTTFQNIFLERVVVK